MTMDDQINGLRGWVGSIHVLRLNGLPLYIKYTYDAHIHSYNHKLLPFLL